MMFSYQGTCIYNGGVISMNEFSVYWWDDAGEYYRERRLVEAEEAVKEARSLIQRPAAKLGIIKRVIITDGGDCIVFEWIDGIIVFDGEKHTSIKT